MSGPEGRHRRRAGAEVLGGVPGKVLGGADRAAWGGCCRHCHSLWETNTEPDGRFSPFFIKTKPSLGVFWLLKIGTNVDLL